MIGFIISVIIIAVVIITIFIVKAVYKSFVKNHSVRYKQLVELNKKYTFYDFVSHDQEHVYDNKNFYNDISEKDYLIYQLQFIQSDVIKQINLMKFNNDYYLKYEKEVKLLNTISYDKEPKGYIKGLLNHIEKKEFNKLFNSVDPCRNYSIDVTLYLSKINDQIYAKKTKTFFSDEILGLIKRLKNRNGNFFNDKGIWNSICRVERGKVSNKLRFAVYKRDGYRCRICGKSQNSAFLEVDHIYPIARGGNDQFKDTTFDYIISNPPFGIDWKKEKDAVEKEAKYGFDGRFGPGLPSISDGQLLFMLNGVKKLKKNGRMAIIQNGSSLFSGDAGSGPSEIRKYLISEDMVEAIIRIHKRFPVS